MTGINTINKALQAIWNPEVKILMLNSKKNKPQRLKETFYLLEETLYILKHLGYGKDYFPYHSFDFSLITKIQDGFLSCPLLQLETSKPEESNAYFEDTIWDQVHAECSSSYEFYGLVDKTYYIGELARLTKLSSVDYTQAVSKTKTLLYMYPKQSQPYYLHDDPTSCPSGSVIL